MVNTCNKWNGTRGRWCNGMPVLNSENCHVLWSRVA